MFIIDRPAHHHTHMRRSTVHFLNLLSVREGSEIERPFLCRSTALSRPDTTSYNISSTVVCAFRLGNTYRGDCQGCPCTCLRAVSPSIVYDEAHKQLWSPSGPESTESLDCLTNSSTMLAGMGINDATAINGASFDHND